MKRLFFVLLIFSGLLCKPLFSEDIPEDKIRHLIELSAFLREHSIEEFDYKTFTEGAVSGMLRTLDPHSTYINEEAYQRMMEEQHGNFYGIGMIISERNGKITVISPIENTPASKIGLRAGDIIYEIDGESTEDFTTSDAVSKLRGEKDTKVNITIKRPGYKKLLKFTVKRAKVEERSVDYYFMVNENTGYLQIKNFAEKTASETLDALKELKSKGMKQLVLDLRNNPGGLLSAAVDVSDFFLPKGDMIVYVKGKEKDSRVEYFARKNYGFESIPVVVLINVGSASGSEIVAGCIQDNDRGLVVGKTSWGKGLVQSVFEIDRKQALALTTAKYYTPSGRCIQRDYSTSFADYFNPRLSGEEIEQNGETFKTLTGREVLSSGGIKPDVEVSMGKLSPLMVKLRISTSAFFRFAVAFSETHTGITPGFRIGEKELAAFKEFLNNENIEFDEVEFQKDIKTITAILEDEIISNKINLSEGRKHFLEIDEQFQKAVTLFDESTKLYVKSNNYRNTMSN